MNLKAIVLAWKTFCENGALKKELTVVDFTLCIDTFDDFYSTLY